jgi:hypothetical protein
VESLSSGCDLEALQIKPISIYWLYLSGHYRACLPVEPFLTLNEERRPEMKRIKDLEMKLLQILFSGECGISKAYCERWNKIVELRAKQKEAHQEKSISLGISHPREDPSIEGEPQKRHKADGDE